MMGVLLASGRHPKGPLRRLRMATKKKATKAAAKKPAKKKAAKKK
jgi:hypothetical protein